MNKHFIISTLIILSLFTSCSKETLITESLNPQSEIRSSNSLEFTITLPDQSTTVVYGSRFIATHLSGNQLSITVNHTMSNPQTFTATNVDITDADGNMKLTRNPGFNETVYSSIGQVFIHVNSSQVLVFNTSNQGPETTTTSIIGEETEGF